MSNLFCWCLSGVKMVCKSVFLLFSLELKIQISNLIFCLMHLQHLNNVGLQLDFGCSLLVAFKSKRYDVPHSNFFEAASKGRDRLSTSKYNLTHTQFTVNSDFLFSSVELSYSTKCHLKHVTIFVVIQVIW